MDPTSYTQIKYRFKSCWAFIQFHMSHIKHNPVPSMVKISRNLCNRLPNPPHVPRYLLKLPKPLLFPAEVLGTLDMCILDVVQVVL